MPPSASGQHEKIVDMASKFLPVLEETKKETNFYTGSNLYSVLHAYYGLSMGMWGNFKESRNMFEKSIQAASRVKDLFASGFAEHFYGLVLAIKGEGQITVKHLNNSERLCEKLNALVLLGNIWTFLGYAYYLLGELETARNYIDKGIKRLSDSGRQSHMSLCYLFLSAIYFDSGELLKAQGCIEEALKLSQKNNEKHYEEYAWIWLGRTLAKANSSQSHKAEEHIMKGIKTLDELKVRPWSSQGYLFLGELYADTGQIEKALEKLRVAELRFQEMRMDYWLAKTQEVLARL